MKLKLDKNKITFSILNVFKCTLIFVVIFITNNAYAQNDEMPSPLKKIANLKIKKSELGELSWSKDDDGIFIVTNSTQNYLTNLFINSNYELLYTEVFNTNPGYMFADVIGKYINKNASDLIEKKFKSKNRKIVESSWFWHYFKSEINNKEMIQYAAYIDADPQNPLPNYFFDINGNFLFGDDNADIKKIMGVEIEKKYPYQINTLYYIKNKETGKYMDVYGNSKDNHGIIVQWNLTNSPNQQFQILSIDQNKHVKIQNENSLKMLSGVPEGKDIIQFESDEGERQIFEIDFDPNDTKGQNGYVKIKLTYSGKYLTIASGNRNAEVVRIIEDYERFTDDQLWELIPVE
ncbi:MAG: RICIN domain-containing protein [Saprospirales bacterium]|nr:RICIN domain-containing protein [Saprospirales bacterium]